MWLLKPHMHSFPVCTHWIRNQPETIDQIPNHLKPQHTVHYPLIQDWLNLHVSGSMERHFCHSRFSSLCMFCKVSFFGSVLGFGKHYHCINTEFLVKNRAVLCHFSGKIFVFVCVCEGSSQLECRGLSCLWLLTSGSLADLHTLTCFNPHSPGKHQTEQRGQHACSTQFIHSAFCV